MENNAGREDLRYDAFGSRVVRTVTPFWGPTQRTLTVGGLFEARTTSGSRTPEYTFNVYGNDGVVAQVKRTANPATEEVHFIHPDHLGNPDAVTRETTSAEGVVTGELLERGKYEPFGERRYPWALAHPIPKGHAPTASYGFTGHEPEDNFGLINMRGRLYDSKAAHFVSPDPLGGAQAPRLNRYSYVHNLAQRGAETRSGTEAQAYWTATIVLNVAAVVLAGSDHREARDFDRGRGGCSRPPQRRRGPVLLIACSRFWMIASTAGPLPQPMNLQTRRRADRMTVEV